MKRLLLTGASGFLGWNLCQYPQQDWEIIGLHHRHPEGVPAPITSYSVNLTDPTAFRQVVERLRPDAIVHFAAISDTKYCQENPTQSHQLNVETPGQIAAICAELSLPMIHASSGQVYSGDQAPYRESDPLQPLNAYGKQKVQAEERVLSTYAEACIFRPTVMFGHHSASSYCFMTDWINKMKKGEVVTAFHDEVRCFLSGRSAAEGIFLMLEHQATGIFNLAGKAPISRLVFAELLAETFQLEKGLVRSASQHDIPGLAAVRPTDLSMNLEKMTALGFQPSGVREELERLV